MNYEDTIVLFITVVIYLLVVNITAFIMYYADKRKAVKHRWRIPESTLIGIAVIGGSMGAFAAMKVFRHKTKHPKFYITVPILMVIHLAIVVSILFITH